MEQEIRWSGARRGTRPEPGRPVVHMRRRTIVILLTLAVVVLRMLAWRSRLEPVYGLAPKDSVNLGSPAFQTNVFAFPGTTTRLRTVPGTPLATNWQLVRASGSGTPGKSQREWIEAAVLDGNSKADSALYFDILNVDPAGKTRMQDQFARCLIRGLRTRDNSMWRSYSLVCAKIPAVGTFMPVWREPRKVRQAAADWLSDQFDPARRVSPFVLAGLDQGVQPMLCNLAKNERDPGVRLSALRALGNTGGFSREAYSIMLGALNQTGIKERLAALKWFGNTSCHPEKIVPALVRGLEDDSMRSDYAEALRSYGPKARFASRP